MKAFYIILTVSLIAIGTFLALSLGGGQQTLPKIKLSYFQNQSEVAQAIGLRLQQEIKNENHFWFGVEPEKDNHLQLALETKKSIEAVKGSPLQHIYIDKELRLTPEQKSLWSDKVEEISLKDEWANLTKKLINEKQASYFILTASIYSTSFLKENPIHKMKVEGLDNPITFSSGVFSAKIDEEKNQLFSCSTENREGIYEWACATLNKSRTQRRRWDIGKSDMIASLMDLTGEKDYMILLR